MFRKRRFKRKTIGKLEVFFKKKAYNGFNKNLVYTNINNTTNILQNNVITKLVHYKIVTKKKI